jgi:hypothetical protein
VFGRVLALEFGFDGIAMRAKEVVNKQSVNCTAKHINYVMVLQVSIFSHFPK